MRSLKLILTFFQSVPSPPKSILEESDPTLTAPSTEIQPNAAVVDKPAEN